MSLLTPTISLNQHEDGWWLYDYTRGMNLSIRAKTPQDAFVEAIGYYQRRLTQVEADLKAIQAKVDTFVEQVHMCSVNGD